MKQKLVHGAVVIVWGLVMLWAAAPGAAPVDAQSGGPVIVASFTILADIAQQVAGDAASVESLIPLGADPHSYEPGARDIVRLSEADLVLVVGMDFEGGLQDVFREAAGDRVMVVSACVPVLTVPEGVVHEHDHADDDHADEDHTGEDHADGDQAGDDHADEDHVGEDHTAEHCHEHDALIAAAFELADGVGLPGALGALHGVDCAANNCDPHVWTDPVNAAWWALAIRDRLMELDPANAAVYEANTRAYLDELSALHGEIAAMMSGVPQERRLLVTNHAVFTYFAARYGLTPVGVVLPGGGTASEPSVREVLALVETIQELGVNAIFTEPIVSDSLARQIADEAGIVAVPLLTGSLGEPGSGAESYLGYARVNATRIAQALRGY